MKILMCEGPTGSLEPLADTLSKSPDITIVDVVRTGKAIVDALARHQVDVSVLDPDILDLDLAIEKSKQRPLVAKKVIATDSPTVPLIVKAHHYGIDDVIPVHSESGPVIDRLSLTLDGKTSMDDHPVIKALHIRSGQFRKHIRHTDDIDVNILQLLSVGMTDDEMSDALSLNIQILRNRIAHLIHINDLLNRTQLAILQAANWIIPDFT